MPLPSGTRVGPYEITARIGAGGMGEVYRARDTRLDRDVALKVLPATFTDDPDRRARFEREAKVLASLNHPNIAQVFGFEDHAIAMELVEGPTLADLISGHRAGARDPASGGSAPPLSPDGHTPLSGGRTFRAGNVLDDVLPIMRQIAGALEAAHEQGIVHRDLKPANVKVRLDGAVKVLDFGLAKALAPDGSNASDPSANANSPTLTARATAIGMILGTAAYMSPEQARGRAVDRRADIWAFGVVFFEMLTGRRVFGPATGSGSSRAQSRDDGEDVSDILAAVLKTEPDWSALSADLPPPVVRLLRRCLEKDPKKRLRDIGEGMLQLDDALAGGASASAMSDSAAPSPSSRARWYERAALPVACVALVALLAVLPLVIRHVRETSAVAPTVRLTIAPPDGVDAFGGTVSPDGRFVVFTGRRPGGPLRLWVRALDTLEARELPGAAGSVSWSPDSRVIAVASADGVRTIDVASGTGQIVSRMPATNVGGAWGPDGTIIFAVGSAAGTVLWRVPATGGEPVVLTALDEATNELHHIAPHFLPDGRRFLFTVTGVGRLGGAYYDAFLGSLDTAERTKVVEGARGAVYVPPGYLLFLRDDTLVAQPFDAEQGVVRGEATSVVFGVQGNASVSPAGVLVYRPGTSSVASEGAPVWVDRQGHDTPIAGLTMDRASYPRVSPDGRSLAFVASGDVWVGDLAGRPPIRLTFSGSQPSAFSPLWTPDGQHLVYEESGGGLWMLPADGRTATPARVSPEGGHFHPHGWSADGRELVVVQLAQGVGADILALPFGEPGEPRSVIDTPATEGVGGASLSPDGRWLAYAANPTGATEIWVRPYPGPGAPVRVSPDGGLEPVWSRDGRELFYRRADRLMSVRVLPGAAFRFEPPELLFESSDYLRFGQPPAYDVAPDGRFVMIKRPPGADGPAASQPLVVVLNWLEEFERQRGR